MTGSPGEGTPGRTAPTELGQALVDGFGGARGAVDSALPTLVFAVVDVAAPLRTAVVAAAATGVALALVRAVRRQPLQQVLSGLVGLAIACVLAARTGKATAFFLPGVLLNWLYALVLVGSLVVRRPLVAVVLGQVSHDYAGWRGSAPLRRALGLATAAWAAFFVLKAVVSTVLYAQGHATGLALVKLGLGWPPLLALAALTVALGRGALRQQAAQEQAAQEQAAEDDPAADPAATRV